jgi:hypothetical protein
MGRCTLGLLIGIAVLVGIGGCATQLASQGMILEEKAGAIAVGRVAVVITGESKRIYEPAVRSFELINQQTSQRFQVEIQSEDQQFALALPPGEYELNRVQINEGPFMSMAQLSNSFALSDQTVTYLGTWRFGVDSPRYGRRVVLSIMADEHGLQEAAGLINEVYPSDDSRPMLTVLPVPAESEWRLYEVMSYPRVPRYFQRHQW